MIRPAEVSDYRIINEYDDFAGDRRIDMERGELFVADTADERSVGFLKLTSNEFFNKPMISIVNVRPNLRGRGIASALIRDAIERANWHKVYTSTEADNDVMHHLLPKLGFVRVGSIGGLNFDEGEEVVFCFQKTF